MKTRNMLKVVGVLALGTGLLAAPAVDDAWARAGGGRSFGGGARRFSAPTRPYTAPSRPYAPSQPYGYPGASPFSRTGSGGFLRSLAGGAIGGMLGGMLFRSLGFGGMGGLGGGFGLMDLLIIGGIGYAVYAFVRRSRATAATQNPYYGSPGEQPWTSEGLASGAAADAEDGVFPIRRTDPGFDEAAFREWCTDTFFRIQAAWMHRDLESLRPLLSAEAFETFRRDVEELRSKRQTNHLENITVRSVELTQSWQEQGFDYVTVRYLANLLDFTVEDGSGRIVSGSDREPVKFQEFWTWVRPVGGGDRWQLAGIQQVE